MRLVSVESIVVEARQRKRGLTPESVADLAASIEQNTPIMPDTLGLINPIVVRAGNVLVAGERRLRAFQLLKRLLIPVLDQEHLSVDDAAIIELEENVKRLDVTWQERCYAAADIHRRLESKDPEWNQGKTAERLGVTTQSISRYLALAEAMGRDPSISEIASLSTAFAVLQRQQDRRFDDMLTGIQESIVPAKPAVNPTPAALQTLMGVVPLPEEEPEPAPEPSILLGDFLSWSALYSGPKFNFIHCDFPYGAGADKTSSQINAGGDLPKYEDSREIFWELCQGLLDCFSNVVAPSAHIMLWLQTEAIYEAHDFFSGYSNSLDLRVFRIPLVWHKSDNTGVVSDPSRRARHIYETAFVLSRGDRKIVQSVSDVYSCPVSRGIHPAEKPQPMLEHFFRMFVSPTTRMLDPTSGSGTALRAAETLGADKIFGIERDPKFYDEATAELERFRRKRSLNQLLVKEQLNERTT